MQESKKGRGSRLRDGKEIVGEDGNMRGPTEKRRHVVKRRDGRQQSLGQLYAFSGEGTWLSRAN